MNVELISTGSELLSGRTLNRHAQTIGLLLKPFGLKLDRDTTVTDDVNLIAEAVHRALKESDLVFVTGGLGPTSDDVTRDAVSLVLGRRIVCDAQTVEVIRKKYEAMGRVLSPQGERQAWVLDQVDVLSNPAGMAPGQRVEVEGKTLFLLPGPPRELAAVFEAHIVPWLQRVFPEALAVRESVFMLSGIGESDVVKTLENSAFSEDGLSVSYRADLGRVEICLSATGDGPELEKASEQIEDFFPRNLYARERISIEEAVGRLLIQSGETLAVAESCTGGQLGDRITSVSGSSHYFLGGILAYSNAAKVNLLHVNPVDIDQHGSVSETVAKQMALGARETMGADWGVGITGIAGPTGGSEEKPVGRVYIAIASDEGVQVSCNTFSGDRKTIKKRSCLQALDLLRRGLLDVPLVG